YYYYYYYYYEKEGVEVISFLFEMKGGENKWQKIIC
ncbi:MAG: hypothetical protein RL557_960, partial [archaeon]